MTVVSGAKDREPAGLSSNGLPRHEGEEKQHEHGGKDPFEPGFPVFRLPVLQADNADQQSSQGPESVTGVACTASLPQDIGLKKGDEGEKRSRVETASYNFG